MTTQQSLSAAFKERDRFFAHRSSAIFPLLICETADLHIVFMNYWKIKNGIERVGVNFRVYNSQGDLVVRAGLNEIDDHMSISIREDVLSYDLPLPFEGMVEVEIVSSENLRFTFPGIIGVYESQGCLSAVHSAGRVKNADELKIPVSSEETNWTCKFEREDGEWLIVPFFHYFVGATPLPADATIEVVMRDALGSVVQKSTVPVGYMKPFSSKIFRIDEILDLDKVLSQDYFVSVKLVAHDIFPRMVVGNYHKKNAFLEVTHSFPLTELLDYCPNPKSDGKINTFSSMLTAQRSEELELDVRVFPTNCPGEVRFGERRKTFSSMDAKNTDSKSAFKTEPGNQSLSFELSDETELLIIGLDGEKIPSRLNASFRYSVKNADAVYSTDIATGAKSSVYPPKFNHWGHGCIGGGYDTHILFHNNSHSPEATLANAGKLRILGLDFDRVIAIEVPRESCIAIKLSEVLPDIQASETRTFISWYLSMNEPVGEAFWIAFRKDGVIFGEHAF